MLEPHPPLQRGNVSSSLIGSNGPAAPVMTQESAETSARS